MLLQLMSGLTGRTASLPVVPGRRLWAVRDMSVRIGANFAKVNNCV